MATKFWGNNYGYDPWGNLLGKSVTKCSAESLNVGASVNNRIHTLSGPDYAYDAAGNMTHDATTGNNYSVACPELPGRRNADGNRVEKSNGSPVPTADLRLGLG